MLPTPRQRQVYEFLRAYIRRHGSAPTYEEIRRHFGFRSYHAVQKHLRALEERGELRSPWGGRKRALTLVEPPPHALAQAAAGAFVPLFGEVAAGRPLEPFEHPEPVEIPPSLLRGGENFALRVRGNSMIDEGIHDGDIVIVRRQTTAENGQTVVAMM